MVYLIVALLARLVVPFLWFRQWPLRKRFVAAVRSRAMTLVLPAGRPGVSIGADVRFGRNVNIQIDKGARLVLEDRVLIGDDVYLHVFPEGTLILREAAHVNSHVRISAYKAVEIGSGSALAAFTSIHDHHHVYDLKSPYEVNRYEGAPVTIGRGVQVLARVGITEGVSIGDFCTIGANSVVTKSIPEGAFAAGVPARVIRRAE
ncbi:MAG: acyltransferase [Planctomycetota bacterium]